MKSKNLILLAVLMSVGMLLYFTVFYSSSDSQLQDKLATNETKDLTLDNKICNECISKNELSSKISEWHQREGQITLTSLNELLQIYQRSIGVFEFDLDKSGLIGPVGPAGPRGPIGPEGDAATNTDNQNLSINGNTLSLQRANTIDLSKYLDNTDAQTLNLNTDTLSITGSGNTIDLSKYLDNTDTTYSAGAGLSLIGTTFSNTGDLSSTNEIQDVVANQGLVRNGSNSFGLISCTDGQILKNSGGNSWVCANTSIDTLQTVYDNSASPALITTSSSSKPLLIKAGVGADTANLFEIQDASGSAFFTLDSVSQKLTVKDTVINGTLSVNGHIVSSNSSGSTTIAVEPSAGTGATASISGNDVSGLITVTTGSTLSPSSGSHALITFANAYGTTPNISLTPANANAATIQYYVGNATTTSFTFSSANTPPADTTVSYYYHVIE